MKKKPEPGTRVRMTRQFLRNTGQVSGGDASSKWTVQECGCGLCRLGRHVATDQASYDGSGPRHIAFANLEKTRARV